MITPLDHLVEQAGGALTLARTLGVTHQAMYPWIKRGWLPTNRALQASSIYGVPHTDLMDPLLQERLSNGVAQ